MKNSYPIFQIINIIKIKRGSVSLKTTNKACAVLSCRTKGKSSFFYKDSEVIACRGDILYIPSGSSYEQKTTNEELICFHLLPQGNQNNNEFSLFQYKDVDFICNLFETAYNVWKNKEKNYQYECMSILYKILGLSFPDINKSSSKLPILLSPAINYIDINYLNPDFSLNNAYKQAHISQTYFHNLFRKYFHCTPISYVNQKKIQYAKELLLLNCYTHEEIAEWCNFNNVKYFYVAFKKITGLTPKQYVKQSFLAYPPPTDIIQNG